jgi:hypothetical protein
MSNYKTAPQINITVVVDTMNHVFSYFDNNGSPCNGGAEIDHPNTLLIYTLISNDNSLTFLEPELSLDSSPDPDLSDLTVSISPNKQVLTIIDADLTNHTFDLKLVVAKNGDTKNPIISSDPRIINK